MEEITQYFKRKDRKTSSESSEGATPEEKRTKLSQANNMPTPSDMAEGVEGVLSKLQLVLDKLVSLETKVDSINKHVCSIDAKVLQLQNKVTTLESSVKENAKTVNEMEAGVTALNADVEEIKAKADKTSNEVITLRQQQWYLETYQRRENLRFYGIPERLDEQENTREVLVNFMINELNLEDAPQIEFQRVHRVGRFDASQHNPRQIIARFLRYGDREKVFSQARQLKGTGMGISPDLPKGVVDIRKKQIETLKKAKKEGKRAYFSRAEPDKLYVDGHLIPVSE
ncbi:uncharacterized protein LOC144665139 [Oculina patagonica]